MIETLFYVPSLRSPPTVPHGVTSGNPLQKSDTFCSIRLLFRKGKLPARPGAFKILHCQDWLTSFNDVEETVRRRYLLSFKAITFIQQLISRMAAMTSMSMSNSNRMPFVGHLSNIALKIVGVVSDVLDPVIEV